MSITTTDMHLIRRIVMKVDRAIALPSYVAMPVVLKIAWHIMLAFRLQPSFS